MPSNIMDWLRNSLPKVDKIPEPEKSPVYIKGVDHVAVDQARSIDERHEGELLLLRSGDLRLQVVNKA